MSQVICKCGAEIKDEDISFWNDREIASETCFGEVIASCRECGEQYEDAHFGCYNMQEAKELLINYINELKNE